MNHVLETMNPRGIGENRADNEIDEVRRELKKLEVREGKAM